MNFNLYPIHWLPGESKGNPFLPNKLPFDIAEGVCIEAVRERFREDAFTLWVPRVGSIVADELERVRFALVHRYRPDPIFDDGALIGEAHHSAASQNLI